MMNIISMMIITMVIRVMMILFMVILFMVILVMVILIMVSFVSLRDERTLLLWHVSLYLYQRVQSVEAERDTGSGQVSRDDGAPSKSSSRRKNV